jgi:uncharacterized protein
MRSFIRNLSPTAEFILVVLLWAGVHIGVGIAGLLRWMHHAHAVTTPTVIHVPNKDVLGQIVLELVTLTAVLWIGRMRGWSLKTFGFHPKWIWTGGGMVLFMAINLLDFLVKTVIRDFLPTASSPALKSPVVSELTVPFIIMIVFMNPVFEESLWAGYFVHPLQKQGMWVCVLASAALRTFCHAPLGIMAIVSILPMGVIYGLVYWKWRQLWPLIVAHSLQMSFALFRRYFATTSQINYMATWYIVGLACILVCGLMARRNEKKREENEAA